MIPRLQRLLLRRSKQVGACRIWTHGRYHDGYGKQSWEGRYQRVHRLAWRAWKGPIPQGLSVLHSCDTPLCIEWTHLFLGTQQDNIDDMIGKGRGRWVGQKGSSHHNAVLDETTAMQVFLAKGRQVDIARQFGIQQAAVSKIKRKATWQHIH